MLRRFPILGPLLAGPEPSPDDLPIAADPFAADDRRRSHALLIIRAVFLVMIATVVLLSLLRGGTTGTASQSENVFVEWWWIPLLFALFLASAAITVDALTPRKKLSGLSGALFGLMAGLLATVAITWIIDLLLEAHDINFFNEEPGSRIMIAVKGAIAITLCYLGVSVVYSTQDEFRLIIPYVEFAKEIRGLRPLVMDTSVIIDGRINEVSQTGFITAPVIIPRFVINELQALADSADRLKRMRGRRGLDMVRKMQANANLDLSVMDAQVPGAGVDEKLVEFAREQRAHLLTTDFNLNKVASIHGVRTLNINDLANALKPVAIPGEQMEVEIVKRGENEGQGVGYLDDGTMVVVERCADRIGQRVEFSVTSSIQTSAGRMIFGEPEFDAAASGPEAGSGPNGSPERSESSRERGFSGGYRRNNPRRGA